MNKVSILVCRNLLFSVLFLISQTVSSETLVKYTFDVTPGGRIGHAEFPSESFDFIRGHEVIAQASGDNRISLGTLANYGSIEKAGRAIFRIESFTNKTMKLDAIKYDLKTFSTVKKFGIYINGIKYDEQTNIPIVSVSKTLDLRRWAIENRCFVLEFRANDDIPNQQHLYIDNVELVGSTLTVNKPGFRLKPCWERKLNVEKTIAIYDFDLGQGPTYAHPIISGSKIINDAGGFNITQSGIVEKTGFQLERGSGMNTNGISAFNEFDLSTIDGSPIFIESVSLDAISRGEKSVRFNHLQISLDGNLVGTHTIDGIRTLYTTPVNKSFNNKVKVRISMSGGSGPRVGVIDEIHVSGKLDIHGPKIELDLEKIQ